MGMPLKATLPDGSTITQEPDTKTDPDNDGDMHTKCTNCGAPVDHASREPAGLDKDSGYAKARKSYNRASGGE
jgi:hypothetical protein